MSGSKGSSPKGKGEAYVQRTAKRLQSKYRIAYATAVVRARALLGLAP